MISMCLSLISTPCSRYTVCTSLTRYSCNSCGPQTSSISCGTTGPSVSCWPLRTWSPRNTTMCLPIGIRCSSSSPVTGSLTMSLRRPRAVPPNSTTPSILAISAASFGRRASNNSATRGRPPVMSLVRMLLRGVLARMAPAHRRALAHHDVRTGRDGVVAQHLLGAGILDDDLRVQVFLVLQHHGAFQPGGLVDFLLHGHAVDEVVELDHARLLGQNRHVVGVPLDERGALLDRAAVSTAMVAPMTSVYAPARGLPCRRCRARRSCSARCSCHPAS
jgi:hypothetical protein